MVAGDGENDVPLFEATKEVFFNFFFLTNISFVAYCLCACVCVVCVCVCVRACVCVSVCVCV
jgi:hypothetical protein